MLKEASPGIFSSNDSIIVIDDTHINTIKDSIPSSPNSRTRICAHKDSTDHVHEMIIALDKGSYIRPHKHLEYHESFHMIEGELKIVIFEDNGDIQRVIELAPYKSSKAFFYRLPPDKFHTVILETQTVVFHEVVQGPFKPEKTIYAPWAPEESSKNDALLYVQSLLRRI